MTTPDDTRERLATVVQPHLDEFCERVEAIDHNDAVLDAIVDAVLAALRDSGWVDPPTYWREREDNSRLTRERDDARRALAETIDELRACADAVNRTVLERKEDEWALAEARSYAAALLPVVEAAKAWREAHLQRWTAAETDVAIHVADVAETVAQNQLAAAVDALGSQEPTGHDYRSTGCLHGEHDYCRCDVGRSGPKTPGQCKFCAAPCRCGCHAESREESTDGR